jgi:hypothetical protein
VLVPVASVVAVELLPLATVAPLTRTDAPDALTPGVTAKLVTALPTLTA